MTDDPTTDDSTDPRASTDSARRAPRDELDDVSSTQQNAASDQEQRVDRRKFLGATALTATAGLAGCSFFVSDDSPDDPAPVSTVRESTAGNGQNQTGTPSNQTGTPAPTPGNSSGNGTSEGTPSVPGDQLDEDIVLPDDTRPQLPGADGTGTNVPDSVRNPGQIPIPEDSGGNSTLKDPTKVENSGAVKAEVTPKRKQTKDEKIGGKQENTHGDVVCTTQKRRITAGSGASFLLNPEIGAIWPGAILGAESIAKGQFSPALSAGRRDGKSLSQIRQPIEISLSLRNIDGKNTKTLDPPSRGNFRTALDELLSQYDRQANTPAKMNTTIHQVHSSEQLDVTLGLHYDSNKLDIDNTFDFSSESETNKLLAKFWQSYYTVDVSLPNSVANGLVTDQSKYLNRNDIIVNNVTFGRLLLFSAESKYDQTRIENALSVALDSSAKSANVDLDVETKQTLRDMKINVQVLGGAATDGAKTISEPGEGAFQAIKQFIQDGATYDPKTSPGVPIAYQTKYVSNFDTANTYLTTTYRERNCRPTTSAYRVTNLSWKVLEEFDPGNEEEIYGEIRVTGQAEKSDGFVILNITPKGNSDDGRIWKRSKSSHLNIKGNERKHLSTDATIVFDDAHELKRGSSYIRVAAKPHEKDPTSAHEFGNEKSEKWFLDEAPSDPDRAGNGPGKFNLRWNETTGRN